MLLTNILLAKVKSRNVLVSVQSIASGHRMNLLRERNDDKLEVVRWDPKVQMMSVYQEVKKIKSVKMILKHQKQIQSNQIEV